MAIHGDVIVSTCTGLSDFYAVDTKAFAVVLTRDVPGNLSSTWSLSHKVTKTEQRGGWQTDRHIFPAEPPTTTIKDQQPGTRNDSLASRFATCEIGRKK